MINTYKQVIIDICYLIAGYADALLTGQLFDAVIIGLSFALISIIISLSVVLPFALPLIVLALIISKIQGATI